MLLQVRFHSQKLKISMTPNSHKLIRNSRYLLRRFIINHLNSFSPCLPPTSQGPSRSRLHFRQNRPQGDECIKCIKSELHLVFYVRPTSNGEFVTVPGLNMAVDNNFPLQLSYYFSLYTRCPSLQKYISFPKKYLVSPDRNIYS